MTLNSPPPRLHRLVKVALDGIDASGETLAGFADRTGVSIETIRMWRRTKRSPTLATIEPVLSALGYRLEAVPITRRKKR